MEFFLGADEFDRTVVEKDAAAAWVMIVKSKKLRAAVLIPASRHFFEKSAYLRYAGQISCLSFLQQFLYFLLVLWMLIKVLIIIP